jgi:hypothetical protein
MDEYHWIRQMKERGLGGALRLTLDALEPLGPLGAQMLYVAQPALGLFGAGDALHRLAQALEEPGGIDRLRRLLDDEPAA